MNAMIRIAAILLVCIVLAAVVAAASPTTSKVVGQWFELPNVGTTAVYCNATDGPVVGVYGKCKTTGNFLSGISAAVVADCDSGEGALVLTKPNGDQVRLSARQLEKLLTLSERTIP